MRPRLPHSPVAPHRRFLSLFSALAALCLVVGLLPPEAEALERTRTGWSDGDFESGGALQPPGWRTNSLDGGVRAVASTSRSLSGSRSLQVDDSSGAAAAWAQSYPIQVIGGSTYLFQAYAYAGHDAAPQKLTARYHDSSGAMIASQSVTTPNGELMWSRVQLRTLAPVGAVRATLRIESTVVGTGTMWWDTVDFLRPLFYNGQFENTPAHSLDVPWWTVDPGTGSVRTTTDQRYVRTGNRALRITSSASGTPPKATSTAVNNGITYMPRVFPGITHDFTGWVLPISGTPKLVVSWYDENRDFLTSSYSVINKPKGEWAYYKAQIGAPLDAAYATLTLTSTGGASDAVWDEMSIATTPPSPTPDYTTHAVTEPLHQAAGNNTAEAMVVNGRPAIVSAVSGSPARLQVIDLQRDEVIADTPIPGSSSVFGLATTSTGTVYVGSSDGHLYRWRPGLQAVEDLGRTTAEAKTVFDIEVAPDGRVWGGTAPKAEVFMFDPATGRMTDLGSVSSGDTYARSVAVTNGATYVGTGPTSPKIVRIQSRTLTRSVVPLPDGLATKFVYGLETRGDFLSVKGDSSRAPYRLYNYVNGTWPTMPMDPGGNPLTRQHPMPLSSTGEFYYTTYKQILGVNGSDLSTAVRDSPTTLLYAKRDTSIISATIDGLSGEWIIHHNSDGTVQGLHVGTWTVKDWTVSWRETPMSIKSIFAGPNGDVYTGGYGGASLAVTSLDGTITQYPKQLDSADAAVIGEIEGGIATGGTVYLGSYTGGKIFRYDPSRPWVDGSNPELIARTSSQGQDRPMAWANAEGRTFFGTVPTYGVTGGRLGIIDNNTSTPRLVDPSPGRSVVDLAARGSVAYGSTSRWGGLGSTPVHSSGTVFAYDAARNRKVWEVTPQEGSEAVGAIAIAPNGNLWASAGWNLYEIGPNSGKVLRRVSLRPDPQAKRLTWSDTDIQFIGSRLYLTVGTAVYSVDTTTLHVELAASGAITTQRTAVVGGKLYVPMDTRLMAVTPSAASVPTTAGVPYRLDRCGTADDYYVIPSEPGVAYYVDGVRRFPGNYSTDGRSSVTVAGKPLSGWNLEGRTSWSLAFSSTAC